MIQVTSLTSLSLTALLLFLAIFGRYVLFYLTFQWFFAPATNEPVARPPLQSRLPKRNQRWQEIGWSAITSVIFTAIGLLVMIAYQAGQTNIYTDVSRYGFGWYVLSLGLVLFLQETYYYWLHRWMHKPGVYRWVHKTHHDSLTTSPWTAFSFHPLESVLQSVLLPVLLFIVPLHTTAVILILIIMTFSGAINHLNTEIYPVAFNKHWLGRWLIGATHHSLHHSQFRYNYGLFFTFWDRWMHTESPDVDSLFSQKCRRGK